MARSAAQQLVAAAAALVLAVSCGGDGGASRSMPERAPVEETPVSFEAADGVRLAGRLFGDGRVAIVLSHMGDPSDDQTDWSFTADWLAGLGYRVLTYDTRGVCPGGVAGCSGGSWTLSDGWKDVAGAHGFVRNRGAKRVVLMGASVGSMSSIVAAATLRPPPAAVVVLSGVEDCCGYELGRREIEAVGAPMLFVAAERDSRAATAARRFHAWARNPKTIRIYRGTGLHGTDLLVPGERTAADLRRLIRRFLAAHAPP